jgi:hypothetical protein
LKRIVIVLSSTVAAAVAVAALVGGNNSGKRTSAELNEVKTAAVQPLPTATLRSGDSEMPVGRWATSNTGATALKFEQIRGTEAARTPSVPQKIKVSEQPSVTQPTKKTIEAEKMDIPAPVKIASATPLQEVRGEDVCIQENCKPRMKLISEEAYDSEYVHRGRKLGQAVFSSHGAVSYELPCGTLYVGFRAKTEPDRAKTSGAKIELMLNRQFEASFGVLAPYIRYERKINDTFSATVGYMHYYYPNMRELNNAVYDASAKKMKLGLDDHTNEVFAGLWANVIFRPTIYAFYNFDCDEFMATAHAFLKRDLCKAGSSYILVDTFIGFDHATKPYGITWANVFWNKNPVWGTINGRKGYVFGGVKTNLVHAISERAKLKLGVNFEANGNGGMSWTNFTGWGSHRGVKRMLWYNMAFDYSF